MRKLRIALALALFASGDAEKSFHWTQQSHAEVELPSGQQLGVAAVGADSWFALKLNKGSWFSVLKDHELHELECNHVWHGGQRQSVRDTSAGQSVNTAHAGVSLLFQFLPDGK